MGVELRSFQRRFQTLMGDVKPQIRPRIVVWLDERLAEFKIKGRMELSETLEDPKWIKDYYTSKRESKAAAIKEREARDAGLTTGAVHPKIEEKSESSNGIAHPDELSESHEGETGESKTVDQPEEEIEPKGQGFQLVEVKSEQIEEEDDDMIIVGETLAPTRPFQSQYNPMKQMYGFGGRNVGPFQRKRPRFGAMQSRPFKSARYKPNFRSQPVPASTSFPSHTVTSQSQPQSFHEQSPSFQDNSQTFSPAETQSFQSELLRLPSNIQSQQSEENVDYEVTEGDMYAEYGDESYDSSYLEGDSSLMYDEEGNAVIKGEGQSQGDESMEPIPGTSGEGGSTSQGPYVKRRMSPRKRKPKDPNPDWIEELLHKELLQDSKSSETVTCDICDKRFLSASGLQHHKNVQHGKIKDLSCPICDRKFTRRSTYEGHMNCHNKIKPHQCQKCGRGFAHQLSLNSHGKYCGTEWKKTRYGPMLRQKVVKVIKEEQKVCEYCSKVFKSGSGLSYHIRAHHTNAGSYPCSHCDRVFYRKSSYESHMNTHNQLKPHQCAKCVRSFAHAGSLKWHEKICGSDLKYICDTCGAVLKNERTYNQHMSSMHYGVSFPCDCGRDFKTSYALVLHQKKCIDEHGQVKPLTSTCTCGRGFKSEYHYKRHKKTCDGILAPVRKKGVQKAAQKAVPAKTSPKQVVQRVEMSDQSVVEVAVSRPLQSFVPLPVVPCPCGQEFRSEAELSTHQDNCVLFGGNQGEMLIDIPEDAEQEIIFEQTLYRCDKCGEIFSTELDFTEHLGRCLSQSQIGEENTAQMIFTIQP